MERGGGGGGGNGSIRRRLSTEERTDSSNNLRDLLRFKDDNSHRPILTGLTLSAVLGAEERPLNRTLLDIIRDDSAVNKDHRKTWKYFKDKLRLRRTSTAWTSTIHIPTSDVPIQQNNNRMMARRHSTRIQNMNAPNSNDTTNESTQPELSSATHAELNSIASNRAMSLSRNSSIIPERQISRLNSTNESNVAGDRTALPTEEGVGEAEAEEGVGETEETAVEREEEGGGEAPERMSLMALLAETDRQMGLDGSAFMMDDEEEEEVGESGGVVGGGEYNNCCVCMVRHKGSAFIPCGHTFCRLCSRELWVQRGNCPLCNGFILEILDIF
ncbi:unnamed protein product [Ilex paraguariensis]|uniref:RING-type domain-containing protein n=1 Tax=Ilex paraguariensis TaxID=185542 RepID=A0ABC8TGI9_9AQUA